MDDTRDARLEELARAIRDTAAELNWKPVNVAAMVGKSELSAKKWFDATQEIGGRDLVYLLRHMPGLMGRLFPDQPDVAAVA